MHGVAQRIQLSVIVQYFKHGHTLLDLVERLLLHPSTEVIIHADSDSALDRAAFAEAQSRAAALRMDEAAHDPLRLVHSNNIHEIRGYNKCARMARAPLLLFTQDDLLPPPRSDWADLVLRLFAFRMRPSTRQHDHGSREATVAMVDAFGWVGGSTSKHGQCSLGAPVPGNRTLEYVDTLVVGPIAVRRDVFMARPFNESLTSSGAPGIGFDRAWSLHLWRDGYRVAVLCSIPEFAFLNGYGPPQRQLLPCRCRAVLTAES